MTVVDAAAPAPGRRRRRRTGVLVALAVVVGLLVAGWFVADHLLRQAAADRIRSLVVQGFDASADEVDVAIGGGAILPQLLAGSLAEVDVTIDSIQVGDVAGSASVQLLGVPLTDGGAIGEVAATVTIPSASVAELVAGATGLPADSVAVLDDTVTITTELNALVTTIELGVELRPSAVDGAIALEPVTVTLGGNRIDIDDLLATPVIGDLAAGLLATRTVCIAGTLPAAISLTDLTVHDGAVVIVLSGTDVPATEAGLATRGTC